MFLRWDREDHVEFFEGQTFGLWNEEKDEEPEDDTPGGIPSECSLWLECDEEGGEGDGEDELVDANQGGGEQVRIQL